MSIATAPMRVQQQLLCPLMTGPNDKTRAARLQRIVDRLCEGLASGG